MKKIIFSLSLLYSVFSHGQLFVSENSYMYVGNQFVYVKENTELEDNATILLRREGQLLQGRTGVSANTGEGNLSVYQEGTVNNFAYNYWCSPVGVASNTPGNGNFGITMLHQPTTVEDSTPAIILPMNGYDGVANPLSIAPYWINRFLSSIDYSSWLPMGSTIGTEPGQGFTMKGTSGSDATNPGELYENHPTVANPFRTKQRYDFRGKPNDGSITINVADGQYTLTGNPYPSAIDLSKFLLASPNTTGVAYFYEQEKTVNSHMLVAYRAGYGTFTPVDELSPGIYVPATLYAYDGAGTQLSTFVSNPNNFAARRFSPVGQGFMVVGKGIGTTATMTNSYRVFQKEDLNLSIFERTTPIQTPTSNFFPYIPSVSGFDYTMVSTLPIPQIRINALLNNQAIKQFVVGFHSSATDGMDHAKDALNPNESTNDINFLIEDSECVLSVLQFDENKRLPLVVNATQNASFKLQVGEIINFNQAQNVYLFDAETNVYHDIKNSDYQFVLPQGIYKNRYEITFRNEFLSNSTNVFSSLIVYQNNAKESVIVSNPNRIDIKTINLYDIGGKKIISSEKLSTESEYSISTSSLAEAPYIVEIFTKDNHKFSQKIIVSKAQ